MESARRPAARRLTLGTLLALAAGTACGRPPPAGAAEGAGTRVVAEVLNAAERPGLARQVTRLLRRRGIDVVFFGNASALEDSTRILVRRGPVSGGHEVARALGGGRVESRPDTLVRVDVTILLGLDYRVPADAPPL